MLYHELLEKAIVISKNSYSPYSKFPVGACVLTSSGKTYCGCNFENASYGLSNCAERNAIGSAVADGQSTIKAIAIYSPLKDNCTPCGACRQVLSEFGTSETEVIVQVDGEPKIYKLGDLLPEGFTL